MQAPDLAAALTAYQECRWDAAHEQLRGLLDAEDADPRHLEALAEAAWWVGNIDDTIAAQERAYRVYSEGGQDVEAARVAVALAEHHLLRRQAALGEGWLARADRLLEGRPPTPELGHLRRLESVLASSQDGGLDAAIELAAEVEAIGRATGDRDLEVLGIHDQGRFAIASGSVDTGMAMMQESMMSAVTGELGPRVTGRLYCNMIDVCASMADYRSAGEWSDRAMRWCDEQANASGFPGICRIRRSELMRLRGAWPEAEAEASRAASELGDFGPYMAAAYNELGMVKLGFGARADAEAAFRKAHSLGSSAMPGLALLRLADGDAGGAAAMIEGILEGLEHQLERAKLLPSAIEIALAAGSPDTAERHLGELTELSERFDSDLLRTLATQGAARIASWAGRTDEALTLHRQVVEHFVAEGLPYETARARCDLAMALRTAGSDELASLELEAAQSGFETLGARADIERIGTLTGQQRSTRATTMMFTDIVESTSLVAAIGDEAWADLLAWHDRTLRALFAAHHGEEINTSGDGFLVAFDDADAALRCAVEIQRSLRRHRGEAGFSPKVRIGIHAGSVVEVDGDLVGHEVHLASRVGSAAAGDEILVTADTAELAGRGLVFGEPVEVDAKGIVEPVRVRSLQWA